MNPHLQTPRDPEIDRIPRSWLSRMTLKLPPTSSLVSPRSGRGFSLVEVTLAMAIVSFGVLSVVSTMPGGMEMLRNSVNDTVESRIAQEVLAKLQGSDWSDTANLASYDGSLCYFDAQGNELHAPGGAAPDWTVFTARIAVSSTPPALPSTTASPSDYLRQVRICITDQPASSADRFTNARKHRQVCTLAAKTSR
jgi:uncharacterized protein (TIGR02598 family)